MKNTRFWTIVALLLATAFLLQSRGDTDKVPYSEPLSAMPTTIGPWISRDVPMEADVLAILGKGDFLNRVYYGPRSLRQNASLSTPATPGNQQVPVSLFIGYFPTQRTGQSIHSPQHCLPGAGWTFESAKYTDFTADDKEVFRVGEYVISDGTTKQFVLYWYEAHGRSIASEYTAKLYMIADAIRLNRTDGAIVRVISPVLPAETVADARERVVRFTGEMAPFLPRFIPN
jgi:EpsI family protein